MELGSEFDLDVTKLGAASDSVFEYLKEFHPIYTDSGRSALRLLSDRLRGETILIPDYICASVIHALPADCKIIYYPLDRLLRVDWKALKELICRHSARVLYLMHYFGTLQPQDCLARIAGFKETYGLTVIEDMTHALFTARQTVGDYAVASLRKWFPIPDGGVLYSRKRQQMPDGPKKRKAASRKVEAMILKHLFLQGQLDCNAAYREIFAQEEQAFDRQTESFGLSDLAHFLLAHSSLASMCAQRQRNVAQLSAGLSRLGYEPAIAARPSDVLLALPVYAARRDRLRQQLIEQNVYCAVHWPLEHESCYEDTRWMGAHMISLPVDQRYHTEEMAYLLKCLCESGFLSMQRKRS